jgi:membrane protease YdiL (CAAX protease family)
LILTGVIGLLYSAVYLLGGRNLWAPSLMHGLYDSFAFIVVFLGLNR